MYICRVLGSRYDAQIRTIAGTQHSRHARHGPARSRQCGPRARTGRLSSRMRHQFGQPNFWGGRARPRYCNTAVGGLQTLACDPSPVYRSQDYGGEGVKRVRPFSLSRESSASLAPLRCRFLTSFPHTACVFLSRLSGSPSLFVRRATD
eukprot:6602723-Prymnesium_polylepis.1